MGKSPAAAAPLALAHALQSVPWGQPWLQDWRAVAQPVVRAVAAGMALHQALNAAAQQREAAQGACPVRFVPQSLLPAGRAYESFIFDSKECPVREGLHDFFNGLCWLQFPRTKARLNALQASHIALHGVQTRRGPLRDALTVFDENTAFLLADASAASLLWPALRAKDWQCLLLGLRPLWSQARLVVFGHALLEKLVQPRKPLTAHVFIMDVAIISIAKLDVHVASNLHEQHLIGKPFMPLPVLGVPGWWPANENAAFYDDPRVFRVDT